jgi:hypothetical protein
MECHAGTFGNLIFGLVLSILFVLLGFVGLHDLIRLWYWFEWLHWKQTQWFFGFSKEVLKDPQENVHQGVSQYPWSVKLIRGISGYLFIFGSISLIIMIYLIVKFFLDCF